MPARPSWSRGGSKGIGLASGRVFLEEVCKVILVARDAARLAEAGASLGNSNAVSLCPADMARAEERARVAAEFPEVDILVNNAGAIPAGGLLDLTMETWESAWALKVMGYIHLTQSILAR